MIALTRRYRFPAAHVLRAAALSDAENERVYGRCANPAGHGHDYGIEVTVTGPVDALTGRIVDLALLDALVEERVLARFGHRMLNDDPAFAARVPTAENIALVVWSELEGALASRVSARVARVRVVETGRNHFEVGDPR